ncbi:MAG: hypothetical protein MUF48_12670, partial [Pirellulaceae bacterium]|nr:hypothetical protein [Pirellulaceae bacterium]
MPTWLLSLARCAQAACLIVAWCAGSALGQEPASPAEAAAKAAPAAESKPAAPSAPAPDAAPPAAAETSAQSPAGGVGTLPPFDLTRLAHPNVADALELSDEQRASVARLINEMATAQDGADPAARADLRRRMDEQLAALLSEGQRAKLATLADTQQKLRFNFRGQKWDEVLDWFARQAGLALVMDQPPAGTFNYSDNRTYSPTEAIDLLNLMLATRGYTLIQRGRLLILADLSKELPVNIIPRVTPEEIAQRGRSEFVSVLFPLGGRPADSVVKEITPLLGQYGTCTALPQTGQLFVTTTAGKMQEISTVITSIPPPQQPKPPPDKPPPPQPKLEVYPVTNIDPAAAVRTLELLFPSAKFQIDDTADQIMAYATPNEQAAIKGAIDQMQANRPPENRPRLEIYPLELANTEELLDQLTQALPSVQATYDTAQGRLLVFAEPKDQEQVRSFVQKLGADLDEGDRQVVVYQPKHFDPTALVTLVKQLMPRAEVAADAALRRVVVSASPANQAMIKALVDQLDAESALEDAPVLQVYPLEQRLDETLLQSLRTLVPKAQLTLSSDGRRLTAVARVVDQTVVKRLVDQWAAVAAEQDEPTLHIYPLKETLTAADVTSLKTLVPAAEATLGPDGRQLRVVARAADHVQIAALLKVLEQAAVAAQQDEPTLKIYPLEETLTATDVASLKTLVPAAEATLGPDGRQLRVVARAADHVQIAALLEQFELAAGAVDKPQLAFYQLDGVSAAQLQTLFQPRVVRSTITVDSAQDRLIVWGPREEHEAFAQIVQQLSQDPLSGTKPELKYYPLPDASLSTSVTTVLTSMAPAAKITWDAATQRLMVIATPKDQQVVRDTLEQVLRDAGPIEPPELRFYPLADGADARFRQLQPDLLTQFPGIRIVEDPDTGELAVWAKASQHAKLAQLLESFRSTSPSTERPVLISYPIQRGSAKAAFDMLKELFPTLKMALDEKKDRVLVSAPLSQHARIKMAIGQVDVETPPESQEELRSYSTGNINPTPLLTMLQSLLPDMQLSADAPAQKIIAWGTVADHEVLSRALEQFREGDPERRPVVKIYPLEGRDYTTLYQLRSVLMQVVPEAVIGVDSRGGAIIVSARAADQTAVETAIKQMVDMDQLTELRLETYTLDKLKATPTLTTLRLLAPPPAQLSVGAVPEQIVVWGTSKDHERIRAALAKLEETGGADAQRELRLHRVRKAASTQAASIIATTLPEVQVLLGQGTEELLIWASPRDHTRLEELIKQLEAELRLDVDRQIKTFELDDVDPAEARRVLDATVGKLEYLTTTVPGRLVVRAEPAALEKVAAVLTELKQVLALPEQVVRVHRYDPDELSVSTLYAALSTADTKELTVQVNPATNSLIVRGPAARQDELAATLSQLALQLPAPDKPIAEVYRLERAEVNTAATVVRSLVPTAVVAVDATNQTLAITTTAKDHTRIKEIIQQLDSSEGGELLTRTYLLKRAYPSGIMTAIKPIVPRAIISPDPYSKSLIVTATAEDHTRIKAIVDEADGLGGGELRTQAYPLQWSSPYAIMTALTPIVPNATLSPDVYSKTLIVTANESDHARVKTVIEQADRRSGGPWTTKAYPLKWANPSTVSSALTSVVPDAKVSSDPVNKMLIVTASAEDHARIDEVLQQADKRGGGGELVTKAYTLRVANPSTIVAALTPVVPNATISSDPTNQMLVATASEDDHVRIQAIIDEADRRKDGELTTEVYALQWANPSALSYSIKPIAPNASVSPDIYNKTLIVTATAKDHARIKAVIDQADRRGGGELLTKAYPLKWANASTISTAL